RLIWFVANMHSPTSRKLYLLWDATPFYGGILFLAIFLFLSFATALIDPAHWTLIVVEIFQIQSPSTYINYEKRA
ncbi:hypothetical protein JYT94_00775, partial [bacterium AH-315-P11]|nr:hypothetical protein [bacterium AH-315-P11]